jgi:hypothetical protein
MFSESFRAPPTLSIQMMTIELCNDQISAAVSLLVLTIHPQWEHERQEHGSNPARGV